MKYSGYCNLEKEFLMCCGTMLGIRCVGVGVGEFQSEDPFVCFGMKLTQRACMR